MKYTCSSCNGSGRVTCPACDGECVHRTCIDRITIPRNDPCYDQLLELQADAKRVIRQCAELKELRPQFAAKYDEQRVAVLDQLERQAEKLLEERMP